VKPAQDAILPASGDIGQFAPEFGRLAWLPLICLGASEKPQGLRTWAVQPSAELIGISPSRKFANSSS
jgi:hypothetical protein